jgi:hypothetical protein
MRISHKHKFIFYAVNKTGSSSIRQYFFEELAEENEPSVTTGLDDYHAWCHHHTTFRPVRKHFETIEHNYDDYLKFSFTRNPWDRELSIYHYIIKRRDKYGCPQAAKLLNKSAGGVSFENWIKSDYYSSDAGAMIAMNLPQCSWVDFNDPKFFVFSYENLQKDFNSMCDMIGLKPMRLGHNEKGAYRAYNDMPYMEYYDDEMMEIVSKKCVKDIKTFNYKFGE